mmetsp:Transcript_8338/g.14131  ORF Transcript_8338/g.14131 Transcript_8338/m.14131 type:complete len:202 (+) Transcript_8338:542-1147(+)
MSEARLLRAPLELSAKKFEELVYVDQGGGRGNDSRVTSCCAAPSSTSSPLSSFRTTSILSSFSSLTSFSSDDIFFSVSSSWSTVYVLTTISSALCSVTSTDNSSLSSFSVMSLSGRMKSVTTSISSSSAALSSTSCFTSMTGTVSSEGFSMITLSSAIASKDSETCSVEDTSFPSLLRPFSATHSFISFFTSILTGANSSS